MAVLLQAFIVIFVYLFTKKYEIRVDLLITITPTILITGYTFVSFNLEWAFGGVFITVPLGLYILTQKEWSLFLSSSMFWLCLMKINGPSTCDELNLKGESPFK